MKYLIVVCIGMLFFASQAVAQKGKQFPEITGETLTDKTVTVPKDTNGKITLLGLAYSKKSDKLLKAWFEPMYNTFVNQPKETLFVPTTSYDVNIYFIGMLKGLAKTASGKIETAMNKNLDPKLHKYTVLSKVKIKEYKSALNLGQKDLPYFFILDSQGKIIYNTSGAYSDNKLSEIIDAVDSAH